MKKIFSKTKNSKTFKKILKKYKLNKKKVLDLGCGFGQHLVNFKEGSVGVTSTKEEFLFGQKNNLKIILGNVEKIDKINLNEKFEIIWSNNLFEHILSPHAFLIKLKNISDKNTILILGVPIIPKIYSLLKLKKFRGSLANNHINFFTKKTLEKTVFRAGWRVKVSRSFVFKNIFLDKIFNIFSPHIYIIAENNVDFKYSPKKIAEWINDEHYQELLKITRQNNL